MSDETPASPAPRPARLTCAECAPGGLDTATDTGEPLPMRGACSVCGGPWPRDFRAVRIDSAGNGGR